MDLSLYGNCFYQELLLKNCCLAYYSSSQVIEVFYWNTLKCNNNSPRSSAQKFRILYSIMTEYTSKHYISKVFTSLCWNYISEEYML